MEDYDKMIEKARAADRYMALSREISELEKSAKKCSFNEKLMYSFVAVNGYFIIRDIATENYGIMVLNAAAAAVCAFSAFFNRRIKQDKKAVILERQAEKKTLEGLI